MIAAAPSDASAAAGGGRVVSPAAGVEDMELVAHESSTIVMMTHAIIVVPLMTSRPTE